MAMTTARPRTQFPPSRRSVCGASPSARLQRLDRQSDEEPGSEPQRLHARALGEPHTGDAAREAQVVADHRAGPRLAADRLGLDDDRVQPLGGAVDRSRQARRSGADDDEVGHEVRVEVGDRAVHLRRHLRERRVAEDLGGVDGVGVGTLLGRRPDQRERGVRAHDGDDLPTQLGVDVVAPVRDAHPLQVVDDPRDLGHLHGGDDLYPVDLDVVRRPAPVREHLDDGGVELLVARRAGDPQPRVHPALGEQTAQRGKTRAVCRGREQDDAPRRRVDLVDPVEQLDPVAVGERHLRCHQGDSVVVLPELTRIHEQLFGRLEDVDVVVVRVARAERLVDGLALLAAGSDEDRRDPLESVVAHAYQT